MGDAHQFIAFETSGYAKAIINFKAERTDGSPRLSTETRITATDPQAREKFARYWRLVHPGSAIVRRLWLNAIKRLAEANS